MKKNINPKDLLNTESKYSNPLSEYLKSCNDYVNKLEIPKTFWAKFFMSFKIKALKKQLDNIDSFLKKDKKINDKKHDLIVMKKVVDIAKKKYEIDQKDYASKHYNAKSKDMKIMANMELRSGNFTHFIVPLGNQYFIYDEGMYLLDDEYKYYDVASKIWCLDYHQDCALPLKRKFDLNAIYKALEDQGDIEAATSINPISLKIFKESEIIQKVMKGAEMEQWLGFVKLMLILICVGLVVIICMMGFVLYKVSRIK